MQLLRRLGRDCPIALRMGFNVAIPVLTAAVLGVLVVGSLWHTEAAMERLRMLSEYSMRIAGLVLELQKERGMSAVFVGSNGQQFANELPRQREASDLQIAAVKATAAGMALAEYSPELRAVIESGLAGIAEIAGARADITAKRMDGPATLAFYTSVIGRLLSVPREAVKSSDNASVTAGLISYYSYLSAKERAAQERGNGGAAFAIGQFSAAGHRAFLAILADQRAFFEAFDSYATAEQRAFAQKAVSGPLVEDFERLRRIAVEAGPGGSLQGITGPAWFNAATARMDLMKQVEDRLAADLGGYASHAEAAAAQALVAAGALVGTALVVSILLGIWLARGIIRPISGMTQSIHGLAGGDLEVEIHAGDNRDEIGTMARALVVLRDAGRERAKLEREVADQRQAYAQRNSAMERHTSEFGSSIAGVMAQLAASAETMSDAASRVSGSVGETRLRATQTADGAGSSSTNLATVAAATEEMSTSINEISRQVAAVARAAADASDKTKATDEKVGHLVAAAERIGAVVALISDIAGQTNLLALNATIEASRAGDAGRGFAVVAGEVKALAAQTAKATDEIRSQIAAIRSATTEAADAVRGADLSVTEMNTIAISITSAIAQQSATTREIVVSVQAVAGTTEDTTRTMRDVCDLVGDAETATRAVSEAAHDVGETARQLRTEMEFFLDVMESPDKEQRRRYERIPCPGLMVELVATGLPRQSVTAIDMSRGGVAVSCPVALAPGTEVRVRFAGGDRELMARVARVEPGVLALAFRQDEATLATVDAVIERLTGAMAA
jgi:methyl-accepting chemotaxis protein